MNTLGGQITASRSQQEQWACLRRWSVLVAVILLITTGIAGLSLLCIHVVGTPVAPYGLSGAYYLNTDWQGDLCKNNALETEISHHSPTFQEMVSLSPNQPFSVEWTGYINIPADGKRKFITESDDGSWLWIDEMLVVDNGGAHGLQDIRGKIFLTKGLHKMKIRYVQMGGVAVCRCFWEEAQDQMAPISSAVLLPSTRINALRYKLSRIEYVFQPEFKAIAYSSGFVLVIIGLIALIGARYPILILQPPLWLSVAIPLIVFLITRLPFYVYYPVPAIGPDAPVYLQVVEQFMQGTYFNSYGTYNVGYSLFLWLALVVFEKWIVVIILQSLFAICSAFWLLYAVHRVYRNLALPAAIAIAAFLGSSQTLEYEFYTMTESIYVSGLFALIGCLLLGICLKKPAAWVGVSCAIGWCILVRTSGLFLLGIYLLLVLYLVWKRYGTRCLIGLNTPVLLCVLGMCLYNHVAVGTFSITSQGEAHLSLGTGWFWTTDPSFPPEVNRAIEQIPQILQERAELTEEEWGSLFTSWNPYRLFPIYIKINHPSHTWSAGYLFNTSKSENISTDLNAPYLDARKLLGKISWISIKKRPTLYARFILANLWFYYFENSLNFSFDIYAFLQSKTEMYYNYHPVTSTLTEIYTKYAALSMPPAVRLSQDGERTTATLVDTPAKTLHEIFQLWHGRIFRTRWWMYAYAVIVIASMIKFLHSRGTHQGACFLCVLFAIVLGSGVLSCLVQAASERYAYPMQIIYYVSFALSPALFLKEPQ